MRPERISPMFRSLSVRLLVPLLVTILAVLGASAWLSVRVVEKQFTALVSDEVHRYAGLIQRATHDGMLLNRKSDVQNVIRRLGQGPGVESIRIYDMDGRVAMSSEPSEIGTVHSIDPQAWRECGPPGSWTTGVECVRPSGAPSLSNAPILRNVSVISNQTDCSVAGCHVASAQQPYLGMLELEMSMSPLSRTLSLAKAQTGWTMLVLMLVMSVVSVMFIDRFVLRPVATLRRGSQRIARGELDTRIEVSGEHELAQLAVAFNGMASDLESARDELADWSRRLEEKVVRKSEDLQRTQRQVLHMEKMASLGKLSATVAHELNNPISSMLTYARLIERQLADEPGLAPVVRDELKTHLQFLQQECSRCGTIVQNLLLFARGRDSRTMQPVDVNDVVARSLMLVRHHLMIHGIHERSEPFDGDATIVADSGQLEQALVALMVNAVEAMTEDGQGDGELTVAVTGDEQAVEISISDTGVGIPPEARARIFEPFFSTKREISGVGLGLAVVYGIVSQHGGRIDVDSSPGDGTTFRIHVPRTQARPTSGVDQFEATG